MSYYERQFAAFLVLLAKCGFITPKELDAGKPAPGTPVAVPALTVEKANLLIAKGAPTSRDVPAAPRFETGQRVRARNINPVGHTRLPRYARGKLGVIDHDHGVFVFPGTNPPFLRQKPPPP